MTYEFVTAADANDATGLPPGWPVKVVRKHGQHPPPPAPWQALPEADFVAYVAALQPDYDAWREAHPEPAEPHVWSTLDFLLRFTPEERAAARASTIPEVQDFLDLLRAAGEVRSDHPLTQQGMELLVMAGLLTAERKAAILSP